VTHPNVPPEVAKRADQLVVGDRIAAKRLPFASDPGEVLLVRLHDYRGADWVFVAWMQPDGYHDSTSFLPDATIEVVPAEPAPVPLTPHPSWPTEQELKPWESLAPTAERVAESMAPAEDLGVAFDSSQVADADATPVPTSRRYEPHTGGMTNRGLVDESDREVHCFTSDPHEPHPTVFAPEMGIANGICPGVELSCQGAPAGFEADCGKPGPHGPHGPELVA
jgi:hypothetical protein